MDTSRENPRFTPKKITRAILLASPFLITACGNTNLDSDPGTLLQGSVTRPTDEEVAGVGVTTKTSVTPKVRQDVQAATVKIRVGGDAILPRGLTSVDIQRRSGGSGFFINDTGYIVTNNHVVTGAGQIEVQSARKWRPPGFPAM